VLILICVDILLLFLRYGHSEYGTHLLRRLLFLLFFFLFLRITVRIRACFFFIWLLILVWSVWRGFFLLS
jgi:hypothetical protein